jgi:hypothetical protein
MELGSRWNQIITPLQECTEKFVRTMLLESPIG